jgi:hypothetical protein
VKYRQKTIITEEKLGVISLLEPGERIVDAWHNVRFTHISVRTILDNADRTEESAKSGTKVFV